MHLCHQLHALVDAGFPIHVALRTVADTTTHARLRSTMQELARRISRGHNWEASLRSLQNPLPPIFTNMLILGHETGNLSGVLLLVQQHFHILDTLRRTIFSVIWYPIILCFAYSLIMAVTSIILKFINGAPTVADLVVSAWSFFGPLVFSIAFAYALVNVLKDTRTKKYADRVIISIPVFGELLREYYLTNFFNALAISIDSGMLIEHAFRLATETIDNNWLKYRMEKARLFLHDGESLHSAMKIAGIFPQEALAMTAAADHSASWTSLFKKLAEHYITHITATAPGIIKAAFPLIIVVMAIVYLGQAGFTFIAMFLFFMYFLIR